MAATTDTKNYKFNHTMSAPPSDTPSLHLLTPLPGSASKTPRSLVPCPAPLPLPR